MFRHSRPEVDEAPSGADACEGICTAGSDLLDKGVGVPFDGKEEVFCVAWAAGIAVSVVFSKMSFCAPS